MVSLLLFLFLPLDITRKYFLNLFVNFSGIPNDYNEYYKSYLYSFLKNYFTPEISEKIVELFFEFPKMKESVFTKRVNLIKDVLINGTSQIEQTLNLKQMIDKLFSIQLNRVVREFNAENSEETPNDESEDKGLLELSDFHLEDFQKYYEGQQLDALSLQ
jgi:hypothetical protein